MANIIQYKNPYNKHTIDLTPSLPPTSIPINKYKEYDLKPNVYFLDTLTNKVIRYRGDHASIRFWIHRSNEIALKLMHGGVIHALIEDIINDVKTKL